MCDSGTEQLREPRFSQDEDGEDDGGDNYEGRSKSRDEGDPVRQYPKARKQTDRQSVYSGEEPSSIGPGVV
jgi:hypothetical protein